MTSIVREPKLWMVGCSITHGVGVQEDQRYGQLVADYLNIPVRFLTRPGSSITWAADKILTSDIQKNDIIVWGLTGVSRFSFMLENQREFCVLAVNFDEFKQRTNCINESYLVSYDLFHRAKRSIYQVINFSNKVGAKLKLGFLPLNDQNTDTLMYQLLKNKKEFVELYDINSDIQFLDLGTDNIHPGVITHKFYAEKIIESLKEPD